MSSQVADLIGGLDGPTLRSMVLELVRVMPDARALALQFLNAERTRNMRKRSLSIGDLMRTSQAVLVAAADEAPAPAPAPAAAPVMSLVEITVDDVSPDDVEAAAAPAAEATEAAQQPPSQPQKSQKQQQQQRGCVHGHDFRLNTFFVPTMCCHCNKMLKGLFRQGYECRRCLLTAHERCMAHLPDCANRRLSKNSRRVVRKSGAARTAANKEQQKKADLIAEETENETENETEETQEEHGTAAPSRKSGGGRELNPPGNESSGGFEDDNESYFEENSTDEDESEAGSDDDDNDGSARGSRRKDLSVSPVSSTDETVSDAGNRNRLRTGTREDWKKHGSSFRQRLSAGSTLTPATIG
jgi:hypothetical protein